MQGKEVWAVIRDIVQARTDEKYSQYFEEEKIHEAFRTNYDDSHRKLEDESPG